LTVDHSEYPPASVEDVVVAEGVETSGIEVLLERGETLVGTVFSGVTGEPLPGAVVSVEGPAARQATALGDGRFEVRGLLAGSYELTVKAKGHARKVIRSIRVPAAEEVRIVLDQGATVRGVVKDAEGEPQSGRMVMLAEGGSFGPNMATTDVNGEFSFTDISAGKHTLMLMSMGTGGGFSMEAQTRQVTVKAGEEVFVEFGGRGAVRKATLKGRLLDRGKPVGTRMLMIVPVRRGGGLGLMSGMKMVTTDAEGRFNVPDLEPGRYAILSSSMGSGTMTSGSEIVIDEGGEIERDIELPPGRVTGKVVRGDTGDAVIGAQVTLLDPERVAVPARSLGDMLAIFKGQARTGEGGAFEFPNAPVGRFMLQVIVDGAAPAVIDAVEVTEAGAAPLTVTVVPGSEVTVTVSDPEGEPFPRATVFVLDARGRIVLLSQSLGETTGPDGTAGFRLVPGVYRVQVQAEGHAQASAPLSVGGGQAPEVAVRLARGGTVRVAVTSGGGPVAGADVRVFGEDGLEIARRVTQESMMVGAPETVTGDDGTVTLENQPAGNLRLVVTATDGRKGETRVLVAEAGEHEVAVNLK
ncbi:MAG: MSCRAMM family protein, partial [Planctomycetota bacterium]